MNPNPDAYGDREPNGANRWGDFSFDFCGGAVCSIVPESLAWPELGNEATNMVYVTIRLSGDEMAGNYLPHLRFQAGLDVMFGSLYQLRDDLDALLSGSEQRIQFPRIPPSRHVSFLTLVKERLRGYDYMLYFKSSFPQPWETLGLPLVWEVDKPPVLTESDNDPFALKLVTRIPIHGVSISAARDRMEEFIAWVGEKRPGL